MTNFENCGLFIFFILFLCFRALQPFLLLMHTIYEFPRQLSWTWYTCPESAFHRRRGVELIVLEFYSIQKISHGLKTLKKSPGILQCMTFIPGLLSRTPPMNIESFHRVRNLFAYTKGNTHFRVCLSIEKRGLWHLGTHRENALGPQLLVGKRTSLVHEFINPHFL